MKNALRTFALLLSLTLLLMALGYVIGWLLKIPVIYTVDIAFVFAIGLNFASYWYSHKWVLKMYDAEIVSEADEPELHDMISTLASKASLPKPRVAIIDEESPNAFATGRSPSNSVVAVTKGAKEMVSKDELEGILSHELAHIKNRDMLVNTMAAMIAGAIAYIGIMGRFSFLFGGGRRRGDYSPCWHLS